MVPCPWKCRLSLHKLCSAWAVDCCMSARARVHLCDCPWIGVSVSMWYVNEREVEPDWAGVDEVGEVGGFMSRSQSGKCQTAHHSSLLLSVLFQPLFSLSVSLCKTLRGVHTWSPAPRLSALSPSSSTGSPFLLYLSLSHPRPFSLRCLFSDSRSDSPLSRSISLSSWKRAFPPGREPDSGCFGSGHPHR